MKNRFSIQTKLFAAALYSIVVFCVAFVLISANKKAGDQHITRDEAKSLVDAASAAATSYGGHSVDRNRFYFFDEFTTLPVNGNPWVVTNGGVGGSALALTAVRRAKDMGILSLSTGTSTTGHSSFMLGNTSICHDDGILKYKIRIDSFRQYATAADPCTYGFGFFDLNTSANQSDAIYFLYDSTGVTTGSTPSMFWQTCVSRGGSKTFFETSVPVSNGGTVLDITVMEGVVAADSVIFAVNDVPVRAETSTNIPVGGSRSFGAGAFVRKGGLGATNMGVHLDYIMISAMYPSPK